MKSQIIVSKSRSLTVTPSNQKGRDEWKMENDIALVVWWWSIMVVLVIDGVLETMVSNFEFQRECVCGASVCVFFYFFMCGTFMYMCYVSWFITVNMELSLG